MRFYFKNIFFFLFFQSFTVIVNGQNDLYQCGTEAPSLAWENEFQKFIAETKSRYEADKSMLSRSIKDYNKATIKIVTPEIFMAGF